MKKIKRYLHLYRIFAIQFMKTLVQSKLDFVIGLFGFFLTQIFGIAFLYLIFEQIPEINGWDFNQLIFIYGFAQIPRGLDHFLTDNVWLLAYRMVQRGEFDRYLLRPINPFFQIICDKFQPDALGELLVGTILIVMSIQKGVVSVSLLNVVIFLVSVLAGALIYTSIKLFFASIAFWIKRSGAILQVAYETSEFAKYPIGIYSKPIRFLLSWGVPFAFVAFFPASFFLTGKNLFTTVGIEVVIAIIEWCLAYGLFNLGLKAYESAGN